MTESIAQRRLLDAAVDAFAENGFGGTSTREIAERAGRSAAALYIHYPSKEAVLYAVSLEGHTDALDCLKQAADSADEPPTRLRAMVLEFSRWHMRNAKVGRIVQYEFHALSAAHKRKIVALRRLFHAYMVEVLNDGVDRGAFAVEDVNGTARALLSLCIDLVRWFDPQMSQSRDSVAKLNAELAFRMVRPSS